MTFRQSNVSLAANQITSESVLTEVTKDNLVDMNLVVGKKIVLREVLRNLSNLLTPKSMVWHKISLRTQILVNFYQDEQLKVI